MKNPESVVLVLSLCLLGAAGRSIGDEHPARSPVEWQPGSFLIQLHRPLVDRTAQGSFSLQTGTEQLDAAIEQSGVSKIEYALTAAAHPPRDPEAFRRWGLDRIYRFHVSDDADIEELVARFGAIAGVDYAEPDYFATAEGVATTDPWYPQQWNFEQPSDHDIDAPEAWDIATGAGAVIAILDTGIDYTHEDLVGQIWVNPLEISANGIDDDGNGYVDDVLGWDFANQDNDPMDDQNHGTRVASVAAAKTNNGVGMAGACWSCQLMAVKVADASGNWPESWFADGVIYATDAGARVINYSAGGDTPWQTGLSAINYAYDAGVVLVGGAGNAEIAGDMSGVVYPKARSEFIASGGTDTLDDRANPFECSGSTKGSRYGKEVDVVTPASLIVGATRGGGYGKVCGNSFAGPQLEGLVGLIHELDPSAGREEIRHLIRSGAEDEVGDPTEDTPGFDIYYGWGRTNMHRTLQAVQSAVSLHVDGKSATRPYLATTNPVASSYDFIRGDLGSLAESWRGVDLGTVVCIENDSPDPDTLGTEDPATPAPAEGFFYLARFNAAPGAGSYGGSSRNRDRAVFAAPGWSWSVEGDQQNAWFGASVGTAGDVNNDTYDDVVVGAEHWDGDQIDAGGAFVYLGSPSGLEPSPASSLEGSQSYSSFGWSVATAGDVNGDGYDDVIVGAPLQDNGEVDEGCASVFHGNGSGVSATPDWVGEGDWAGAEFGFRVRTAGDVNDDGYDDVIVGAPGFRGRGRALVYLGSASGLAPYDSPDWAVVSDQVDAWYGAGVGTAGSVNCDAYDDVIVGAPSYDNGEIDEGRLYVYYGSGSGLSTSPAITLELDVANARLGYAAFTAGDVNGDNCGDIIAGAYGYGTDDQEEGAVYVWYGSGLGLRPEPDWRFEAADERFAQLGIAAETVGDVNGDGYDDIIVGADLLDAERSDVGWALVFHGGASGLSASPAWMEKGDIPAAQFGWRVGAAGDVDGDGFDDAIVGDRFYQNGETDEGRATVYRGSAAGLSTPPATSDCAR